MENSSKYGRINPTINITLKINGLKTPIKTEIVS
jgi:hypothetical protein